MFYIKLIVLGSIMLLVACSNKSVYESLKEGNRAECNQMPEYQRQQCLNDVNQSYEDYQRDRDALKSQTDK